VKELFRNFSLNRVVNKVTVLTGALMLFNWSELITIQCVAASNSSISLNELKLRARQAEDNGFHREADMLYIKGIEEAERSGTKTDTIEMISRLVRERSDNQQIQSVDRYVQTSLDIVKPLLGTKSYDREISVWMDDLADVFMDRAKRTTDEHVKDYCARRYLDIEMLLRNSYNQQLLGLISLRTIQLSNQERYQDVVPLTEMLIAENERNHRGASQIGLQNLFLGLALLGARQYDRAEASFKRYFALISRGNLEDKWDYSAMEVSLSKVEFERKNYGAAIAKCTRAFGIQNQLHLDDFSAATSACLLAYYHQRAGNLPQAKHYYETALGLFGNAHPMTLYYADSDPMDAGRVFAEERLAEIETASGNKDSASKHFKSSQKLRAKHPTWSACKNTDQTRFYLIYGHFPFPVEVIPTSISLSFRRT